MSKSNQSASFMIKTTSSVLFLMSFALASCSGGWTPPKEPDIVKAFRLERQSEDCKIVPIEVAKNCTLINLIPNAEWIYFEGSKDGNTHFYNANWRRDINDPKYVVGHGLTIDTLNTKKEGEPPELDVYTFRAKCDEAELIQYDIDSEYPQKGTASKNKTDDILLYNQFRYMCNATKQ